MDRILRAKMIQAIVDDIENWDSKDILECLKEVTKDNLEQETDEIIEEVYNDLGSEFLN